MEASRVTLPRRCLHGVHRIVLSPIAIAASLCLGAACTGCIGADHAKVPPAVGFASALPARGASSVISAAFTPLIFASALPARGASADGGTCPARRPLCLGAACTGCIPTTRARCGASWTLPRRCLHGVHLDDRLCGCRRPLCLGAACTGCIGKSRQIAAHHFVAYAVSR